MLMLQTAAYYFPRWIWKKAFDNKQFEGILSGLHQVHDLEREKENEDGASKEELAKEKLVGLAKPKEVRERLTAANEALKMFLN